MSRKKFTVRYITVLFTCILTFAAWSSACAQTSGLPKVVATTTFIADIARNVAGDHAHVVSLLPAGSDPHLYEPVPGDARTVADADIVLMNGLTLEGWLDELVRNSGTRARVVIVTEGIEPVRDPQHKNATDPHAWMSPINGISYANNIRAALSEEYPDRATHFEENFNEYKDSLETLDRRIAKSIATIPERQRILVTSHDAFRYYGNRYGLAVESVLGTTTDAEIQIRDIDHLIKVIRDHELPAIFVESTINPKVLEQVARDNHTTIGGKLYADALGPAGSGADTYIRMLEHNSRVIVQGLTAQRSEHSEESPMASFLMVVVVSFGVAFVIVARQLRLRSRDGLQWSNYRLEVHGLAASYDHKTVLSNVFLDLEPGNVYGLLGPNGSGKSTLLKSILGLVPPVAGTIRINGEPIDQVRKYIAYVPQKEEIDWQFPATVYDVVLMGRYPYKRVFDRLGAEDHAIAEETMRQLEILDLRNKQISELSGGQQQRVFLARALCQQAEIYFLDEPFVGVDITTENKIIQIIRSIAEAGKLVVIVHHDLAKVREYFDRVILINRRVIAVGPTDDVLTPENIQATYSGVLPLLERAQAF